MRRIFEVKGRPAHNPLIAHVAGIEQAHALAILDSRAQRLAEEFWPGPLTLVLPSRPNSGLASAVQAGLDTLALRWPAHPVATAVLEQFGGPVAAPSANPSGRLSPTSGLHVAEALDGRLSLVLDGGPSVIGLESTIVHLAGSRPVMLRPGAVTRARLCAALGEDVATSDGSSERPSAPGQLLRHYAPARALRLDVTDCRPTEAFLAFGEMPLPPCVAALNLSPSGDLDEAAANLFAYLRLLEVEEVTAIAVAPIPDEGVGSAMSCLLYTSPSPRD